MPNADCRLVGVSPRRTSNSAPTAAQNSMRALRTIASVTPVVAPSPRTCVMNGAKQIQSLKIDPEAVNKEDVEMLQDLILAAINDAHRKVDEELMKQMGGLKIPGLF